MQQKERRSPYSSFVTAWVYLESVMLSKRKIPYDLTYKWNLINKTNKQAKYKQIH